MKVFFQLFPVPGSVSKTSNLPCSESARSTFGSNIGSLTLLLDIVLQKSRNIIFLNLE